MTEERMLRRIRFSQIGKWDVPRFFSAKIRSRYPLSPIGKHIMHVTQKTRLSDDPEKEFKILGISNETGMFDAYTELGKHINQPYIFVENGALAYNPYRINVGSVGLKTDRLDNEYISPAYVVLKCKGSLLPEYLCLVLKSPFFNGLIRENTTGSVRQTLSYDSLSRMELPIPPIDEQRALVSEYQRLAEEARSAEWAALSREASIDAYLFETLGIRERRDTERTEALLRKTTLKSLIGWSAQINSSPIKAPDIFRSETYENKPLAYFCELNPKCVYPKEAEEISFVPMECVSDLYGEITECRAKAAADAGGYTRFQENDVLWAKITPCMQNGKCAVAKNLKNGYGCGSTEFHVLRAKANALPEYIYCFLRTKRLRSAAACYFTGSAGQQRVGRDFLQALTLPDIPKTSADPGAITQEALSSHIWEIKKEIKFLREKAAGLKSEADIRFERSVLGG